MGLGPVFQYEWLRRRAAGKCIATRVLIVGGLLRALTFVWYAEMSGQTLPQRGRRAGRPIVLLCDCRHAVGLGLLVAPAVTAGAVCLDKARGA